MNYRAVRARYVERMHNYPWRKNNIMQTHLKVYFEEFKYELFVIVTKFEIIP